LLLFSPILGIAQELRPEYFFIGVVKDEKGQTLPGAHIIGERSRYGTASNREGIFSLWAEREEYIRVSFIGFSKVQIPLARYVKNYHRPGDTIAIEIQLKVDPQNLREFTITAKPSPEHVYGKNFEFILDYELQDDKVWILLSNRGKKRLAIINQANDTLFTRKDVDMYNGFHKDPYGSVFLVSDDGAVLVSYNKKRYTEHRQLSSSQFQQKVLPIIAGAKGYLYYKYENPAIATVTFTQFAKKEDTVRVLYHFDNERHRELIEGVALELALQYKTPIDLMDGEPAFIEDNFSTHIPRQNMVRPGESLEKRHAQRRDARQYFQYLEGLAGESWTGRADGRMAKDMANLLTLIAKPKVIPLKIIKDTVYIFNHAADSILSFAHTGESLGSVYINYHHKTTFKADIITDEENNRVYFKNLKDGVVHLEEVNLKTGTVSFSTVVSGFTFPEKLCIKNDYLYFLYKDKNEPGKRLYRVMLR
jgi:hypothetical protein